MSLPMKIIIDIGHPTHVHLFKTMIGVLQHHGHDILVTARNKEVTLRLLSSYGIECVEVGKYRNSMLPKGAEMPFIDWRVWQIGRKFNPDRLAH